MRALKLPVLALAILASLTGPSHAQQVTPSFGLDSTGALRNLYVRDPTSSFVPFGILDTTTHSMVASSVPVERYGAKGNGTGVSGVGTDDTAAIASCLSGGRICALRPGATYRITSQLILPSNAALIGPPDHRSTLYMDPSGFNNHGLILGNNLGQRYGPTSQLFLIRGAQTTPFAPVTNITLRDFTVDGGGIVSPTGVVRCCQIAWINNAIGVRISGLEMKNWESYGIRLATVRDVSILNNNIHDFSNNKGYEYSGIQLDDDKFGSNGCPADPLAAAGESCDVEIRGNRISNMLMSQAGYNNAATDPEVVPGYQPNGIKLNGGNRILVASNRIDHTGQPIDAYTLNSIFSNNEISYGLAFCIALKHRAINNLIIGNNASYCGVGGIAIGGDAVASNYGNSIIGNSVRFVGEDGWTGFTDTLWDAADPYCIGWITTDRSTVVGNSCDPGPNGSWAWWPRSSAGTQSWWSGNAGLPGTHGPAHGLWYNNILETVHAVPYTDDPAVSWAGTQTIRSTTGGPMLLLNTTNNTNTGAYAVIQHSRTTPVNGDDAGGLFFQATDSAAVLTNYAALIGTAQLVANGSETGVLKFDTMVLGAALSEKARIGAGLTIADPALGLSDPGLGNARVSGGVQVGVSLVSALPSCGAALEGMMRGVSDAVAATYNAVAVGGGSLHLPVYCNGTAWTLH